MRFFFIFIFFIVSHVSHLFFLTVVKILMHEDSCIYFLHAYEKLVIVVT